MIYQLLNFSLVVSENLTNDIINQVRQYETNEKSKDAKKKIKATKLQHQQTILQELRNSMDVDKRRLNDLNKEQGASSWLTTLPLKQEGYDLISNYFEI